MSGFRRYGRKPVKCTVQLSHGELGDIVAETRDISESGVFIRCKNIDRYIHVGDTIDARLYSDEAHFSDAQMRVVRTTQDGVGLSYD